MSHPAPGKPTAPRPVTGLEVFQSAELAFVNGAATASFAINRSSSMGEALNILDAAKICIRIWSFKAHEGTKERRGHE